MSKINLNNYEAFMLDYLEGNLSQQEIVALKAFAMLHPELDLNFDEELIALRQEKFVFEGKQNLKAEFSDELVIGYLENVLEGKQKKEAEALALNNILFKHDLELYTKTIAIADTSIVFENKESLKRRAAVIFLPQNNYVRVAAALLLLLGLWLTLTRIIKDDVKMSPEMATKKDEPKNNAVNDNISPSKAEEINENNTDKLIAKKNTDQTAIKKEINTSTVNISVPEKIENELNTNEERQLADKILKQDVPFIERDTNVTLMANNSSEEKIMQKYIIEEGLDAEEVAATKPKSKLWNLTSGLLKRLNKNGMENVNSSESNNAMIIGALTISKPN